MFKSKLIVFILFLTLLNISTLADENNPTQEEVSKLYVATFNRAPDSAGLNYWINSSGLKLSEVAQSFFDQIETQEKYPPGTSNKNFIQAVYNNLFNRDPDSGGWSYWEGKLNNNEISKNRFIEAVINGALDNENGQDKTILDNKNEVGLYFANVGKTDIDEAKYILQDITSEEYTVRLAKYYINTNNIKEIEKTQSNPNISVNAIYFEATHYVGQTECEQEIGEFYITKPETESLFYYINVPITAIYVYSDQAFTQYTLDYFPNAAGTYGPYKIKFNCSTQESFQTTIEIIFPSLPDDNEDKYKKIGVNMTIIK